MLRRPLRHEQKFLGELSQPMRNLKIHSTISILFVIRSKQKLISTLFNINYVLIAGIHKTNQSRSVIFPSQG
jgi:hypothetical protein